MGPYRRLGSVVAFMVFPACDAKEACEDQGPLYADLDGDGFGDPATERAACDAPSGSVDNADDCDDTNTRIHPLATELVDDGVDQDCDGLELCFVDADADGFRPDATSTTTSPSLHCDTRGVATRHAPIDDCDDHRPDRHPGAPEVVASGTDEDCDGVELCWADLDNDGDANADGSVVFSDDLRCDGPNEAAADTPMGDCNDLDDTIHSLATDLPGDGVDQDCDGLEVCYIDADNDGHRPDATSSIDSTDTACRGRGLALATAPTDDCDDTRADTHPGARELPGDEIDQNCDGTELCYLDLDQDGDGDKWSGPGTSSDLDCTDPFEAPPGLAPGDCDDSDPTINSLNGTEGTTPDGLDQDCDGYFDEGGLIQPGDVFITEVQLRPFPPSEGTNLQWFELYNASGTDLTIGAGWFIENSDGYADELYSVPDPFPAGGHVWAHNDASGSNSAIDVRYSNVVLGGLPAGDVLTVTFDDPDVGAIEVFELDYGQDGFPTYVRGGFSLQLNNLGTWLDAVYPTDPTDGSNWCTGDTATHLYWGGSLGEYFYCNGCESDGNGGNYGTPSMPNGLCNE